ncbi:MAG: TlpA family protein disulfide reductase [Acidobacteria bacterium]|nr:TlpA family protein disulfide reductase [Acidobacteriota bacterium]MBI3279685.1 TlpA family protein disulfide reductase [Acidobacteriota bacterium]
MLIRFRRGALATRARHLALVVSVAGPAWAGLVQDVRTAISRDDFAGAEAQIAAHRKQHGITPEMLEAYSWLGRGALAARRYDAAEKYAVQTRSWVLERVKPHDVNTVKPIELALGAAIEVQGHVLAARGERDQAVLYLKEELARYRDTPVRMRIQKNIHLLSLEGKPAPAIEAEQWLGSKPRPLSAYRGKAVLLFLWAHWCGDCKQQAPVLARLLREYGPKGLVLVGLTQRYGYAAGGREAGPQEELTHIEQVRRRHYAELADMPVAVSEESFRNLGASTTPTLILIDRSGSVSLYHPGRMPYELLAPKVEQALAAGAPDAPDSIARSGLGRDR